MTWGEQNTEADAHAQLDYATDHGIQFIDTAELYPVPPRPETQGRTETYLGSWLKQRGRRDDLVLATKACGPGEWVQYFRGGPRHTEAYLTAAVEDSLSRLQTDYVDLYQLHWPDRATNFFGQLGYQHREGPETPIDEILRALERLVQSGKIRAIGLSNETPWGVMRFLEIARREQLPLVQSIQNPYSLLNRTFEIGLAEIAHREQVGLLAYSPLGFGVLSGKYRNNQRPAKARLTLFTRFSRYNNPQATAATEAYCSLAEASGMTPTEMALAFVTTRPFVTSNIIGATSLAQLAENIETHARVLPEPVLTEIDAIHQQYPNPAP
ncbi:MAG: NADP(H)-dependent aldo-keto reductase [Gammaproteobacteria bacterium]|nr:NADP(H)-dependent aldo-keto reductase [Gammaproteobacteria bacterium]